MEIPEPSQTHRLTHRPRRLRRTPALRGLCRETLLSADDLIYPLFLIPAGQKPEPIPTLPGQWRWPVDQVAEACAGYMAKGIRTVNLFGSAPDKDSQGSGALDPEGVVPCAVRALKAALPDLCVQTDIALDPYTSHGHDGILINGEIDNDATLDLLARMALLHAEAGADWVAPSDMMDGRVGVIRKTLDQHGHTQTCILAYSAKYASCFYGPFRGALETASLQGPSDKRTYQMDPANRIEALREIAHDIEEGADAVMIKPGGFYLDLVREAKNAVRVPVAVYQVSGEFAMMHAAAEKGLLDLRAAMIESLTCFKRAGADMILTYFAPEMAEILTQQPQSQQPQAQQPKVPHD
ncbi:MAG: porphobilinogen synthase [Verrucomicrobia bacterium]|nr:porphobilinogen synthase [Verrucomicrobiota bacterium]MCH8513601.1 porphobilinogen synthase [Kiritimatiellia bacterium]